MVPYHQTGSSPMVPSACFWHAVLVAGACLAFLLQQQQLTDPDAGGDGIPEPGVPGGVDEKVAGGI